ncbi:MAG: hypothetical protein FD141_1126 [Fusobacteria bacterium]|nr:MAG: hypothetical protein FD141_1126 [Fusobacteriota bacterium]KAF0229839.1 MAG: hypothetical protein FD182_229 [Fusobacteriota bacterium]
MNRKIILLICTFIIFLLFGAGLFSYYSVNERREVVNKFIEKSIKWNDYIKNVPSDKLEVFNFTTESYDEYLLEDVNYSDVNTISKDILKEVKQQSNIKLDRKAFPEKLEYDHNTVLTLSNVVIEPINYKTREWYEEIETQNRVYFDIPNADLYNIPKEIFDKNEIWHLLTDKVSFESLDNNKYNCTVSYSKVKRVVEEKATTDVYNIKAVYSGKQISKTGNVKLKYKLTNENIRKEILPQFSIKFLYISIIAAISIIIVLILYEKLLTKKE